MRFIELICDTFIELGLWNHLFNTCIELIIQTGGVGVLRVRVLPMGRTPTAYPGTARIRGGRGSNQPPAHPLAGCEAPPTP